MGPDFSFSWDSETDFATPPFGEKRVHSSYKKRDGFSISGYTVHNLTQSSMGSIEALNCILAQVRGRDGVSLSKCSASDVSSSMGIVSWNGWNGEQKILPEIDGRDGVNISNISTRSVKSSMSVVSLNNAEASSVEGRNGIRLKDARVDIAETSMGKLFGKGSNVKSISARDGVELIDSKAGQIESSMGTLKAKNCQVGDVEARDGVIIKNSSGNNIKSSMGKVLAISEKQDAERFNLIEARDGVDLTSVSSKTVRSSMGAVNCVGGSFDLVEVSKPSSLKQANIKQLHLNVGKDEELTINLADSVVTSVAIKVTEATSMNMVIGGSSVFIGGGSSMSISGRNISWSLNGSNLNASPNSFLVEGSLLSQFESEILNRCRIGARGLVNGVPAQVTSSGVQIQKEPLLESKDSSKESKTRTKVTFIGGKIVGNIAHDVPVKFDLSKTTFEGKIVSE